MPIVAQGMSSLVFMNEAGVSFTGKNIKDIADAVAQALCIYVTATPNLISFFLSGTAGPVGNMTSITVAGIVPQAMSSLMSMKAVNKGFKGKNMTQLFDAISNGVSLNLNTMIASGMTAGIAVGSGIGRFTYIQDVAVANYLRFSYAAKMLTGKNVPDLIDAISFGFATHMKSAPMITATVLGAIAPVPPVGPVPVIAMPTVFNSIS